MLDARKFEQHIVFLESVHLPIACLVCYVHLFRTYTLVLRFLLRFCRCMVLWAALYVFNFYVLFAVFLKYEHMALMGTRFRFLWRFSQVDASRCSVHKGISSRLFSPFRRCAKKCVVCFNLKEANCMTDFRKEMLKAGPPPLDLSFWSFLTFLHHGIEKVERHLL